MKLNLSNITSGYGAVAALNANFDAIETAVEKTLSRDGTTPNEMLANLDMNGNDILNANAVDVSSLTINGTPVQPSTGVTVAQAFQSYTFTATLGQTSFSVSPYTPYVASVQVEVNGLSLPPADISVSGTNVVIPACSAGDEVVIRRYTDAPSPFPVADDITFTPAGTINTRSVQSKLRDVVSVKDFGADPTGASSSSTAISNAQTYLASIGGGTLYFPPGEYKVTTPIVMQPGITYQGPMKAGLAAYNPNRSRIFSSTGNIFVNSASTITEVCFRDLFIESEAGGGHVFDWSSAGIVAKIEMSGVCLAQRNAAKCVIYGVAAGGVFSIWLHDFEYVYVPECAYPPIWIASTTVNSIVIDRFWSTANGQSAAGNPSIWVESTNPGGTAFNVEIRQGVFEFSGSGSVIFKSVTNSVIEDCTTYDLSISPGYHQFAVLKGPSGPASSNVAIKRCRSSVGTVSFADLFLDTSVAGQGNFLVESCTFLYADGVSTTGGATIAVINSAITNFRNFAYTQFANGATSNVKFGNTLGSSKTYELWNGYFGNGDGYFHIHQNGAYVGAINPSGLLQWGGTRAAPAFYADQIGNLNLKAHLYPGTPAGVDQVNAGLFGGSGAPNNANGNNGDFYFRGDGGAGTSIYMKRAGAWVAIV